MSTLFELAPNSQKSLIWLAPEVLTQNLKGYNEKSDVYSLGIAICELANGITPFSEMLSTYMLTEKMRGNKPTILDNSTCPSEEVLATTTEENGGEEAFGSRERLLFYSKKEFSEHFHKFSEVCLEMHPEDRPTVLQLLNHQFLKQWKHTSLFRELQSLGVKVSDYSLIKGEFLLLLSFHSFKITSKFLNVYFSIESKKLQNVFDCEHLRLSQKLLTFRSLERIL